MPRSGPARKYKHHVIATLRVGDGTVRTEDLGIVEATSGGKARDFARARNAERLGIRRLARGDGWTGKWVLRSTLMKHPEPSAESLEEMPEITTEHRRPGRGHIAKAALARDITAYTVYDLGPHANHSVFACGPEHRRSQYTTEEAWKAAAEADVQVIRNSLSLDPMVKRGLERIYALAYADVQNAEPNDFPGTEREELTLAFEYLASLTGITLR